ncbi:hypothetical protein [Paraclostridium tenue]|uniref:Oligosaccharide repeat unit polymerase n=1 Tax=Paraclostridium tenue TaxID=1737 RepID=A0ABP3X705_9FIRM
MILKHSIKKQRITLMIYEFICFIALTMAYTMVIQPKFSYMGFELDFNIYNFLIGIALLIFFNLIGIFIKNNIIYAIWHIILIYNFYGTVIYYQYNNTSINIVISLSIFLLVMIIFSKINIKIKKSKYTVENNYFIMRRLTFLAIIATIPFFIFYGKYINIKNLLLIDVYETRALFREVSVNGIGYLIAPLTRVVCPVLLAYSIKYKKKSIFLLNLFVILYIYLCGAVKSIFIGAITVIVFYRGDYEEKPILFAKLIMFLTIGGILLYYMFDNIFLLDGFVRRVFFIPPKLDSEYYMYFNGHNTYWLHSAIGELLGIQRQILGGYDSLSMYTGEVLMGKPGFNANVGVLTEGYVSAGYIGVLIHSILISFIYRIISSININPILFGVIFIYIYYLNTAFLSVLLLTHGLLFLLLFSIMFLNRNVSN